MDSIDWLYGLDEKKVNDSLYKVVNWVKDNLYLLIWARSEPKKVVLDHYINFAKNVQIPIKIWIDDVTPRILYNRTQEQQQSYNILFKDFIQNRWIEWEFIWEYFSKLYRMNLEDFIEVMDITDYKDLNFILPEKKKTSTLSMVEFIHYFTQSEILSILSDHDASFLVWKFSAWLYYYFNNKRKRISFIILNKI